MIRTLHERVGRNVIRVQALETSLKALLPLIKHNEEHCLAGLDERRKKFVRKTLGELVGALADSNQTPSDDFTKYLNTIVNDRNNLVHHFRQMYGAAVSESPPAARRLSIVSTSNSKTSKSLNVSLTRCFFRSCRR
jgi:hypothetical protein